MKIRPAQKSDAIAVAPLMVQAMEEMALEFVQSADLKEAYALFSHFFEMENNQYSYENTLVMEEEGEVLGSITAYDGARLNALRSPFLAYLKEKYGYEKQPEDETLAGEFYLDTISVSPHHQGKGIGKQLILGMIERAKALGYAKVGLLVDVLNPDAKRLYLKLGFEPVQTIELMGGQYERLQFVLKN